MLGRVELMVSSEGKSSALPPTPAVVVEDAYTAWLWIDERVAAFPVVARRHLGHRALDASLDALLNLTEAAYSSRGGPRVALLLAVNRDLARLRILLRGARDRRYLAVAQHEHAMRLVDGVGRQVGGWLKVERGPRA
jgi:hypothetical protein